VVHQDGWLRRQIGGGGITGRGGGGRELCEMRRLHLRRWETVYTTDTAIHLRGGRYYIGHTCCLLRCVFLVVLIMRSWSIQRSTSMMGVCLRNIWTSNTHIRLHGVAQSSATVRRSCRSCVEAVEGVLLLSRHSRKSSYGMNRGLCGGLFETSDCVRASLGLRKSTNRHCRCFRWLREPPNGGCCLPTFCRTRNVL
jgi:hypothetical protein